MNLRSMQRGFTLIELLLVIGIIAILAAIVIVAINPTKQLSDMRNAQRRADVNTILNAVTQYTIDHTGTLPGAITTTPTEICRSGISVDCTGLINLNTLTGSYILALPNDPETGTETSTKYVISKEAKGKAVTVAAPDAEAGMVISVTH